MDKNLMFPTLRFNQLTVGSMDESAFAHLSNLQVLDISSGSADLPFNIGKAEDDIQLEEEMKWKDKALKPVMDFLNGKNPVFLQIGSCTVQSVNYKFLVQDTSLYLATIAWAGYYCKLLCLS